jgi:exodeoxyribonuclease V alpha subunit
MGEVVRLQRVFRQAQKSAIVRAAHEMLTGRVPTPTPAGTHEDGDLFLVRARDPDNAVALLFQTLRRIHTVYGLDLSRDVQVLSPMRRGPLGTERLNLLLQSELNPAAKSTTKGGLQPGDKVMQLRNDYDRDVFNGDLGTVTRVAEGTTDVSFDGRKVSYTSDDLDALTLAYASTVHKVQGSEFPAVVVTLHSTHHVLLSRALLYTAITRARRLVVVIGDERVIRRCLARNERSHANSRLLELLRA